MSETSKARTIQPPPTPNETNIGPEIINIPQLELTQPAQESQTHSSGDQVSTNAPGCAREPNIDTKNSRDMNPQKPDICRVENRTVISVTVKTSLQCQQRENNEEHRPPPLGRPPSPIGGTIRKQSSDGLKRGNSAVSRQRWP